MRIDPAPPTAARACGASLPTLLAVILVAGAAPAATPSGTATPPAVQNLVCDFKAVQVGQFQDLSYITGPLGGTLTLRFASSPEDSTAGRAVMIGEDKAVVVALVVQPDEILYVDTGTTNDASVMSLFTGSRQTSDLPAAYSRQMMVGRIPIVSQYAGTCTAQ